MNSYERAEIEVVTRRTQEDPAWWGVLNDYLHKIKSNSFGEEYQDSVFQLFQPERFSIHNAYSFMCIHTAMMSGGILSLKIPVTDTPFPDKAEDENNAVLSALEYPFEAKFGGGLYVNDGYFKWLQPIRFCQKLLCDGTEYEKLIPPTAAPLEVGYTKPVTSLFHLAESRVLARWPYDNKFIHLFVVVNDKLFLKGPSSRIDPWADWEPPIKPS